MKKKTFLHENIVSKYSVIMFIDDIIKGALSKINEFFIDAFHVTMNH